MKNDKQILTPAELKLLLTSSPNPEDQLSIVLMAFAGLSPSELQRLDWSCVKPGSTITVESELTKSFLRLVLISHVLDEWLRPFYRRRGPVVSTNAWRFRLRSLARRRGLPQKADVLRQSYAAYLCAMAGGHGRTTALPGIDPKLLRRRFHRQVPWEQAFEYFSLTPEAVGYKTWSSCAAIRLKYTQLRRRQTSGGDKDDSRTR